MKRALTAEQTQALEERVMSARGLSLCELMALVGTAVADEAGRLVPGGPVTVVCGKGNNAGDGWVAASVLHSRGREVHVVSMAHPDTLPKVAREAARAARDEGVPWTAEPSTEDLVETLSGTALIVDALFGFGVSGSVREPFAGAIEAIGDAKAPVLSVDLPSGVGSDTGQVHGAAVSADRTLAVLALKVGHVQYPGTFLAGEVCVIDLGLGADTIAGEGLEVWDPQDYLNILPVPAPDAHKGSRGRVLLVGGSAGMAGSISLAAWGALRMGAGYVVVAVPRTLVDVLNVNVVPAVAIALPETGVRAIAEEAFDIILEAAERADAVVVGPGLSSDEGARSLARRLIAELPVPVVVDADALNALAGHTGLLHSRKAATVLTPHPGELARLLEVPTATIQEDRPSHGATLAQGPVTCVLKGAGTLISGDGRQVVNLSGNPGLATLGTGDVLAGMTGALLAQRLPGLEAGTLSSHLHGLAADIAAERLTETAVTARDVIDRLPDALIRVSEAAAGS